MKQTNKHNHQLKQTRNKSINNITKQRKHETNQYTQSPNKENMQQLTKTNDQIKQT